MTTRRGNKFHARRRIQRAFLAWFDESRKQLKVPFRITKRCKEYIRLEFTQSGLTVEGFLNAKGLHVGLSWQDGSSYDVLWNEAITQRVSHGYQCRQSCDPEEWGPEVYVHKDRQTYPRREDVWRVHLFEVFLDYVNNTLTQFPWIEIYEIPITSWVDGRSVNMGTNYGVGPLSSTEDKLKNRIVSQLVVGSETDAEINPQDSEQGFSSFDSDRDRNRQIIPNPLYRP